eukprot:gnl/MRDRNA2_/MRDRNA2_89707_c0_seq1.p1 gnl/MRDRNA2_/MRDRNA2_89707_c0~~gnl/MRDRNA2_/MRDRNA2_89707_c0_seq1.p1  ORF type:complete len:393 (-),score=78.45 gnl/MRDRNA2_/MRDRNA2_89707_c0_seq1:54-1232(-)
MPPSGRAPRHLPNRQRQAGPMGCVPQGVFFDTKPQKAAREPNVQYTSLICRILQKMRPELRRRIISTQLKEKQRLALEAYMISKKNAPKCSCRKDGISTVECRCTATGAKLPAIRDIAPVCVKNRGGHKKARGIFKSACGGKTYSYYAKAGFRNVFFVTRMQHDFSKVVQDHVILTRMIERIRSECVKKDFPAAVSTAVAVVLSKAGLSPQEFLRYYSVHFPATTWIGRPLFVQSHKLEDAMEVWKLFQGTKNLQVCTAGHESAAEIEKNAEERWKKMRDMFAALHAAKGKLHRSQLGGAIQEFEVRRRCVVQRIAALWRRQKQKQQRKAKAAFQNTEAALMARFAQLRCRWERAMAMEEQRKRKEEAQESRKRRWDGKESLVEFERRVRCR